MAGSIDYRRLVWQKGATQRRLGQDYAELCIGPWSDWLPEAIVDAILDAHDAASSYIVAEQFGYLPVDYCNDGGYHTYGEDGVCKYCGEPLILIAYANA